MTVMPSSLQCLAHATPVLRTGVCRIGWRWGQVMVMVSDPAASRCVPAA
ncbi:hypothetical protein QFZ32_008445 [Streptomyces canus]|nr:hypothetical protein [Streptomyces canus]